jgi:adenylate cyclase, class 2
VTYEVELKFHVADAAETSLQLIACGARQGNVVRHYDLYLRHPSRDFKQTHEALRIRRTDRELLITYKGPVIDTRTKMRQEIEMPIGAGPQDFERFRELFITLGFQPVHPVEKTRALFHLQWEGRELELAVDAVNELGDFLEIEALAEDQDRDQARDAILRLADRLQLKNPERRSYLAMVLEKVEGHPSGTPGRASAP